MKLSLKRGVPQYAGQMMRIQYIHHGGRHDGQGPLPLRRVVEDTRPVTWIPYLLKEIQFRQR